MTDVDYSVRRSERASKPRIDVDIHGTTVVIPEESDADPDEMVSEKADWIREKNQKYQEYEDEAPKRNFHEGETFLHLGQQKTLRFAEVEEVTVENRRITVPRDSDPKEALKQFYKEEAEKQVRPLLQEYGPKMGVEYDTVAFRNQRTMWGSCSPKKNLSFNWRLAMSPPDVVKYVVVHELAHLKETNHTKRFWRIVSQYHDSHKKCSNWLEDNSSNLIFDRTDL